MLAALKDDVNDVQSPREMAPVNEVEPQLKPEPQLECEGQSEPQDELDLLPEVINLAQEKSGVVDAPADIEHELAGPLASDEDDPFANLAAMLGGDS